MAEDEESVPKTLSRNEILTYITSISLKTNTFKLSDSRGVHLQRLLFLYIVNQFLYLVFSTSYNISGNFKPWNKIIKEK